MVDYSRDQLVSALRKADAAGDTEAARAIARRIQAMEQPQQTQERGRGIQEQMFRGVANAAQNIGAGLIDAGAGVTDRFLGAVDAVTGDWSVPERMREQSQAAREGLRLTNEARNQRFDETATGVERGAEFTTELASYAVPATKVDKAAKGLSWINRGIGQAAAAYGLDDLFQRGEGVEEKDQGRGGTTAVAAFLAEGVAPVFAKLGRAGIRALKGQADNPIEVGRAIARQAGVEDIPDDVAQRLANAADEIEAGARPEAVLAREEFGFDLSRGQLTGRFEDLSQEDLLRQTNQGRRLRALDESQAARQGELVEQMTGGLDSPQTAVDNSRRAVQGAQAQSQAAERAAWSQVEDSSLRLSPRVADEFQQRTRDALKKFPTSREMVPDAVDALKQVDDILRSGGDSIDMRALQDARSTLSSRAANAATPREAAMLNRAKKAFDDALANVDEGARVSGDLGDIGKLREAVGATASKYRTFAARGKDDAVGKTVEKILKTENVDALTSRLLGGGRVTGTSGADFAKALKRTLGDNPEQLQELRQAVLLQAATNAGGDALGPQALSGNIKRLLRQRGDVLKELFSPEEISRLGRMTNALDVLWQKPGGIGRTSGTTERAIRFLESMGGGGIPGLSQIGQLGAWMGRRRAAGQAMTAPRLTPTAPALPAAAAASTSNRPSGQ